jgi:hypothetical protein
MRQRAARSTAIGQACAQPGQTPGLSVRSVWRALPALACVGFNPLAAAQAFVYSEPGIAQCPAAPAPTASSPRTVRRGAPVEGQMVVRCGFDKGSYTVTLNATDPQAQFSPKTFIVNFGRIVGKGSYTVRFSTPGEHSLWATITANMGSPAVAGHFVGQTSTFKVVNP